MSHIKYVIFPICLRHAKSHDATFLTTCTFWEKTLHVIQHFQLSSLSSLVNAKPGFHKNDIDHQFCELISLVSIVSCPNPLVLCPPIIPSHPPDVTIHPMSGGKTRLGLARSTRRLARLRTNRPGRHPSLKLAACPVPSASWLASQRHALSPICCPSLLLNLPYKE